MIVETLSRYPDGLSTERIMDIVYADDPDGGPSIRCLYVLKGMINKKLKPQGWKIVATHLGRGALYQLVPIDG